MYNDPNYLDRTNSQPPQQPNDQPDQPSIPPNTRSRLSQYRPGQSQPQQAGQSNVHQSLPNQPQRTGLPATSPRHFNPSSTNQFRPKQFRPQQSDQKTLYPTTPESFRQPQPQQTGQYDFPPAIPNQPEHRTGIPNQPTQPIPPTPKQPEYPQPTQTQPIPRKGAWAWYKRQKNIAKLGIGCLLVFVLLIGIAASAIGIATHTHNKSTAQVTPTTVSQQATSPIRSSGKIVTFGNGTHIVGKDIQPGTYRTRQAMPNCYYARLSGFDDTIKDIIANNTTSASAIITIDATDKGFQSTNCGTWSTDMSAIITSKASFSDGIYLVGTDIQPGTYKSSGQSGCYFARIKGFGATLEDVIANANPTTTVTVKIAPTDKGFQSSHCGTWTRQ